MVFEKVWRTDGPTDKPSYRDATFSKKKTQKINTKACSSSNHESRRGSERSLELPHIFFSSSFGGEKTRKEMKRIPLPPGLYANLRLQHTRFSSLFSLTSVHSTESFGTMSLGDTFFLFLSLLGSSKLIGAGAVPHWIMDTLEFHKPPYFPLCYLITTHLSISSGFPHLYKQVPQGYNRCVPVRG